MYRCQLKDMRHLRYKTCRRKRLYHIAEVKHLGTWRRAKEKKQRAQGDAGRLLGRKEIVLWRVNLSVAMSVTERERTLKIYFARDFVTPNGAKVRLRDIKARWKALPRVRDILRECPGAHPGSAIDFCVAHPDAGPGEFQELKRKIQTVFRLEGRRILHCLPDSERCSLVNTPLKEDYIEFASADVRKIIRGYLLQKVDPVTADKIMCHAKSQTRIYYGGEESKIARKLLFFWKDRHREQRRRARVTRALSAVGLPMSDGIWEVQLYIKGEIDLPMYIIDRQIRRLMQLNDLFRSNHEKGIREWSTPFHQKMKSIERQRRKIIDLSFSGQNLRPGDWKVGFSWMLLSP